MGRVENIVGKGENAGYQHFLPFQQCFQKASLSRSFEVGGGGGLCGKELKSILHYADTFWCFIYRIAVWKGLIDSECNTFLSAYTKYRHLRSCCIHPSWYVGWIFVHQSLIFSVPLIKFQILRFVQIETCLRISLLHFLNKQPKILDLSNLKAFCT